MPFFLQCMKVKSESEVAQLCPTLRDPMDYSLPGSSVHGIFQARVLEWAAIAFSLWSLTTLRVATMWAAQGPDKQGTEKHTGKMPKCASFNSKFLQSVGQKPGQSNKHSSASSSLPHKDSWPLPNETLSNTFLQPSRRNLTTP